MIASEKIVWLAVAVSFTVSCATLGDLPTDAELIAVFDGNQSDFETLLRMFEEDDDFLRIAPEFAVPKGQFLPPPAPDEIRLTKERLKSYHALFAKLDLDHGLVRRQEPPFPILFVVSARGVVHAGDLVVADDSGICFVPFELVDEVLGQVRAIEAQEAAARELIEKDGPMGELKELFRRRQRL